MTDIGSHPGCQTFLAGSCPCFPTLENANPILRLPRTFLSLKAHFHLKSTERLGYSPSMASISTTYAKSPLRHQQLPPQHHTPLNIRNRQRRPKSFLPAFI